MSETRDQTALTVEELVGEVDEAVAEFMEPRPAPVSARELRRRVRHWEWVSCYDYPSPGGWWVAEIGTDHGPPDLDDEPVTWRPAREPSAEIGDAWLVVEAMRARRFWLDMNYVTDGRDPSRGYAVAGFYRERAGGCAGSAGADTAPLAICLAALNALAPHPSDQPPLPPETAPVLPRSPDPEG
jgi:hypothetical protein